MNLTYLQSFLRIIILPVIILSGQLNSNGQEIKPETPEKSVVTSYQDLSSIVHQLDKLSGLLKVKVIGTSVEGRNLYALSFTSGRFGKDETKIKVLIFAQQHGNEQSGKEGALLLARELIKPENRHLFDRIDLMLVPQVNPDGSEVNARRNARDADLNRNHLTLTEPETRALHELFDKCLFEVSMDVHEYFPYTEEWINFGYRKNSEVMIGSVTNTNISEDIRDLSNKDYLPFIFDYLEEKGFSSFVYCPGGPPEINYIRHSTFDINDGRQSLGIQNTFAFIQEGRNGEDSFIDNIDRRAKAQMLGMLGLLEYVSQNKDMIKSLVSSEREKLMKESTGQIIAIQSEHTGTGQTLEIPLYSYFSGKDSLFVVKDYRPVVRSICDVAKPAGYLIPDSLKIIKEWAKRHSLDLTSFKNNEKYKIEQYYITEIDSIDFEGDTIVNPQVTVKDFEVPVRSGDYLFLSTAQLKGNMIVLALEPKSMLGLVTYRDYAHLLAPGKVYPILRATHR